MSTSYYWSVPTKVKRTTPVGITYSMSVDRDSHEIHIGKYVHVRAPDQTMGVFLWAQSKDLVTQFCKENVDKLLIEDEYGKQFTCADFLSEVDVTYGDESCVGTDFC
jgi:hypothetical protein